MVIVRIINISSVNVFLEKIRNVSSSAEELLKFNKNHVKTALEVFLQIFDSHFAKRPAHLHLFCGNFEFAYFSIHINLNCLGVSDKVQAVRNIK